MKEIFKIKGIVFFGILLLNLPACNPKSESQSVEETVAEIKPKSLTKNYLGNYVSDSYDKRDEGFDWVAVTISQEQEDQIQIKVRSRADKKRPTCTFDATAYPMDESTFQASINGETILFSFNENSIKIKGGSENSEGVLAFYCSGGGSLAGTYQKIDEPLDSSQIDPTKFSQVLNLQGIGFNVTSIDKEGKTLVTVQSFGLEISNEPISLEVNGIIKTAEVEDLNYDGSPELLIYSRTEDENQYGNVMAFSTNNKKSMSIVYFPPTTENEKINEGYQGHDEFSLVERTLIQRFPIFNNGNKTGKTRQISYKMIEGEALRSFEIDQISELD
jgi:hypothetical protein